MDQSFLTLEPERAIGFFTKITINNFKNFRAKFSKFPVSP